MTHFFISRYLLMKHHLLITGMLIYISRQWKILIDRSNIRDNDLWIYGVVSTNYML